MKLTDFIKPLVLVFVVLSTTPLAWCQSKGDKDCKLCITKVHSHESPYELSLKKDWSFVLTGSALAATGYFVYENDNVSPFTPIELAQLDRNSINRFDRGATYNRNQNSQIASEVLSYGSVIVFPSLFLLHNDTRKDAVGLLVMTYEVFSINYGVTNIVKSAVNRTRPYVYNPEDYSPKERTDYDSRFSFFSSHTSVTASLSFLWAKVMTDYHPNMAQGYKVGIWSIAALVPATTGYLRVKAGKHYPTDVLTGYAVGAAIGWLIPEMHNIKNPNVNIFTSQLYDVKTIGFSLMF